MGRSVRLATALALTLGAVGCGEQPPQRPLGPHTEPSALSPDVQVALAGGDRVAFRVRDHRLTLQHFSRDAGAWTQARDVLPGGVDDRTCGQVRAVTDGSTVALTLECDEHYAEDQAPTASVALVSTDLRDWDRHDLEGEAYGAPALAPGGAYAGWSDRTGLVRWHSGRFEEAGSDAPTDPFGMERDGRPVSATVRAGGGRCSLVLSDGTEVPTPLDPRSNGCEGAVWSGPDELVVQGWSPLDVVRLHRDADGRWAVGRLTPAGPGLELTDDPGLPPAQVEDVDGTRVAVGLHEGRLAAQVRSGDGWGPVRDLGEAAGCRWDGEQPPVAGSLLVSASCADGQVAWTSTDGTTWRRHDLGRGHVWRSLLDLEAVLPGDDARVVGASGTEALPALGPCDGVLVDDDGGVLRVTGSPASRGWPTHLERRAGGRWVAAGVDVDVSPPAAACDHAFPVPRTDHSPDGPVGWSAVDGVGDQRTSRYVVVEGAGDDLTLLRMIL